MKKDMYAGFGRAIQISKMTDKEAEEYILEEVYKTYGKENVSDVRLSHGQPEYPEWFENEDGTGRYLFMRYTKCLFVVDDKKTPEAEAPRVK